jgi:hypothetical protein
LKGQQLQFLRLQHTKSKLRSTSFNFASLRFFAFSASIAPRTSRLLRLHLRRSSFAKVSIHPSDHLPLTAVTLPHRTVRPGISYTRTRRHIRPYQYLTHPHHTPAGKAILQISTNSTQVIQAGSRVLRFHIRTDNILVRGTRKYYL